MSGAVSTIHDILSGKRKGFRAAIVRFLLVGFSIPYRLLVSVRNKLYDWKLRAVHRLDCKVIAVGNLTTGGTGKTPLVETLVDYLLTRTPKVVIISRGYGAGEDEPNDEKMVLCENLPDVPHVAGADRLACALVARRRHDARVVIMDDAFQHRRVARDLDIVTVDATNPFGFGHLLPRGLLREPPASLSRADVVVITRSRLVDDAELTRLEDEISGLAPDALIVHAAEQVVALTDTAGEDRDTDDIKGRNAAAFCGLGNPEAFRRTVTALGVRLSAFLVFGDHHRYTPDNLRTIDAVAEVHQADVILTTQKDRVKIPAGFPWKHELRVVKIKLHITRGEEDLKRRLDELTAQEKPVEEEAAQADDAGDQKDEAVPSDPLSPQRGERAG